MTRLSHTSAIGLSLIALIGAAMTVSTMGSRASADDASGLQDPRAAVEARFADTVVDEVACEGFGPLCQVTAGKTVFYVDPAARHAFIGRVYDLDAKRDLTEETLSALRPDIAPVSVDAPVINTGDLWATLPFDSAIVRNRGGALKVAVFSDLNCGYCQRLSAALHDAPDIEVHEFLVGMGQSGAASNAIACAADPERALEHYYETRRAPTGSCDKDIVGPAQAAARAINMRGTPTFVRSDGAVTAGFQDLQTLRAWLHAGDAVEETP